MAIIEIEFEFGKSKADRIIIAIFSLPFLIIQKYLLTLKKNYLIYRRKSRIKKINDINFNKFLYPYIFLCIIVPLAFVAFCGVFLSFGFLDVFTIFVITVNILILIILSIYFMVRLILDIIASFYCLCKSAIVTTIYSLRGISGLMKKNKS